MDEEFHKLLAVFMMNQVKINALDSRSKFYRTMASKHWRNMRNIVYAHFLFKNNKNKRKWSCVKKSTFWEKDAPKFSNAKFKYYFRVNRKTFYSIVRSVSFLKKKDTHWRKSISLEKRIAMSLYTLGSSAYCGTIAKVFGVGRSTLGQIVFEFCRAVIKVYENCFDNYYPATQEKIEENVNGFLKIGFPQCYGAIGGCHIKLSNCKSEITDYRNSKGSYSSILFAAVDHFSRFMYVNVGTPGSSKFSNIWEKSHLKKHHIANKLFQKNSKNMNGIDVPVLLIGDSNFKLSKNLMKPYNFFVKQSEEVHKFNTNLLKCKKVVNNAFSHLKARFQRLDKGLTHKIENTKIIIKACCVLHNISIENNDIINQKWLMKIQENKTKSMRPRIIRLGDKQDKDASEIRNAIKDFLAVIKDGNDNSSSENKQFEEIIASSTNSIKYEESDDSQMNDIPSDEDPIIQCDQSDQILFEHIDCDKIYNLSTKNTQLEEIDDSADINFQYDQIDKSLLKTNNCDKIDDFSTKNITIDEIETSENHDIYILGDDYGIFDSVRAEEIDDIIRANDDSRIETDNIIDKDINVDDIMTTRT